MMSAAPDRRSVVLVAEADRNVGFGHLGEVRAIGRALEERGISTRRIAIGDRANVEPRIEWVSDYTALEERLRPTTDGVMVWSVRTDRWRTVWSRFNDRHHVWVADVAEEYPDVDVLVVPTLEPRWRTANAATTVFAGPSYFPLDVRGSRDVPPIAERPRDVLLTLGGADRTEATMRLIPALKGMVSTVVIGHGFRHRRAVEELAAVNQIHSVLAPDGLRDLLLQHRIVISAGGNTLFEAAAAATPAVVTWEDPHEEIQARSFAAAGAARVIGRGVDVDPSELKRTVSSLLNSSDLQTMSDAARRLIDGNGAARIADLIIDLLRAAA